MGVEGGGRLGQGNVAVLNVCLGKRLPPGRADMARAGSAPLFRGSPHFSGFPGPAPARMEWEREREREGEREREMWEREWDPGLGGRKERIWLSPPSPPPLLTLHAPGPPPPDMHVGSSAPILLP